MSGFNEAYALFHEALPVMSTFRRRGIKVDRDAMAELRADVIGELEGFAETFAQSSAVKETERHFGKKFNPDSPLQKRHLFYDVLGLDPLKHTKTGPSVDAESLEYLAEQINEIAIGGLEPETECYQKLDLIQACQDNTSTRKLLGTYIDGLTKYMDKDDYLHPCFNLHIPRTYRSSSSNPSFHTFPIRKPKLARVRRVMVPRYDWFLEVDYAGAEFRMMGNYSRDEALIKFIKDGYDVHRHYAHLLYEKPEKEISGTERYDAKQNFVFRTFYGGYWENVAQDLHLDRLHVRGVEDRLRNQFRGVFRWQDETVAAYERQGHIDTLLGFRFLAPMTKKELYNYPIQGTAFHRLLRACVDCEKRIAGSGLQSCIIGQIHDSMVLDVVDGEVEDVLGILEEEMTRWIWDWELVPQECEFKIGRNLLEMETI